MLPVETGGTPGDRRNLPAASGRQRPLRRETGNTFYCDALKKPGRRDHQ
jgi:hypothetical protein